MSSGRLGNFYPISSKIHDLNPVVKLLSFFLMLGLVWIVNNLMIEMVLSFFLLLILMLSHVPFSLYVKPIWKMKYLLLGMLLLGYFCHMEASAICLLYIRIINLIGLSSCLLYTTKKWDLIYGMETICAPLIYLKIPIRSMIMMVSLALQFIPNLFSEMDKILKSLICRGMDYRYASQKEKWLIIKATINPMFIYTFRKSDAISDVMALHGYQVEEPRTSYQSHSFKIFDYFYLFFHIIIFICVWVSEVL